jgi:hypothetical protein
MRHRERSTRTAARRQGPYRLFAAAALLAAAATGAAAQTPFVPNNISTSTVPANGDTNPYGVAFVPSNFPAGGTIAPFDILVSNFNNSAAKGSLQGTGSTIIVYTPNPSGAIAPPNSATVFFQSKNKSVTGPDTGLAVLQKGFVLCAFLPSTNGMFATHGPGGILVLNSSGKLVSTIAPMPTNPINAPWDMTVFDQGTTALAFVSNVADAKNDGFVSRLNLSVSSTGVSVVSSTIIAQKYKSQPNSVGFVTGPTGLVYDPATDILYVASTLDNAVYAVTNASTRTSGNGKGTLIFSDKTVLFGPLGMAQAPNGDLIVANSDLTTNSMLTQPSEYVEFTKNGTQPSSFVGEFNIDVNQGGAFGVNAGTTANGAPRLAVVDDNVPNLNIFTGLPPSINGPER